MSDRRCGIWRPHKLGPHPVAYSWGTAHDALTGALVSCDSAEIYECVRCGRRVSCVTHKYPPVTRYVSPQANGKGDGSFEKPWTIKQAMESAVAGDVIAATVPPHNTQASRLPSVDQPPLEPRRE